MLDVNLRNREIILLIALLDFFKYKRKEGRFCSKFPFMMGNGFHHRLPEETLNILKPGDLIFVQTLNSFISWLIMYITKSDISHNAIYIGNGMISHATTGGILDEPIESLFGDSVIVPCRMKFDKLQQEKLIQAKNTFVGQPYNWNWVITKGLLILSCREHIYFRFSYLFDALFGLLILDFPFLYFGGFPVMLWCYPMYLILILTNFIKSKKYPIKIESNTVKPIEVYLLALERGGSVLLDPQKLQPEG